MFTSVYTFLSELPTFLLALAIVLPLSAAIFWLWSDQLLGHALSWANRTTQEQPRGYAQIQHCRYDYGPLGGPHTWRNSYAAATYGTAQSPININTATVTAMPLLKPLVWTGFERTPIRSCLRNAGGVVELWPTFVPGQEPRISSGADAPCTYRFDMLTVHWPAEHTVDNQQFALELQAWHKFDGTSSTCGGVATTRTLAVAYLYRLAANSNPYLQPLVERLAEIREVGASASLPGFPLAWLCAPLQQGFYDYEGSLTAPPCCENVTWLVSGTLSTVSAEQLEEFCQLRARAGGRSWSNARPVQPLNGRAVHLNTIGLTKDGGKLAVRKR